MVMIYMAMNRFLFVMWMVGMLFLSSCSIKEDRNGCPCWMTVEMPGQAGHDGEKVGQDGRSPVGSGMTGVLSCGCVGIQMRMRWIMNIR